MNFFFENCRGHLLRSPEELVAGLETWRPEDGGLCLHLDTPWSLDYEAKVWCSQKIAAASGAKKWAEFVDVLWCETDCLVCACSLPGCAMVKMAPIPAPSLGVVDCRSLSDIFLVPSGFFDMGAGGQALAQIENFRKKARLLGKAQTNVEAYELLRRVETIG